jgi:integrase
MLFSFASREWLAANQARWSRANIAIQQFNLKHLSKFFKSMLLSDISAADIGHYQYSRQQEGASNRTINMEIATLRMIMKVERLWMNLAQDVKMLPERQDIGKALSEEEAKRLLVACRRSPSPSLYPAVVIYCNTGLRNSELRCAVWGQLDFLKAEFHVGRSKTPAGEGRIIPLNRTALQAFQDWRARCSNVTPGDFIFPSEKLMFKSEGSVDRGTMTPYDSDPRRPLGSWKKAWHTAKKEARVECRIHDLRHHFISELAQRQTPDATIQAISGHLSRKMLEHYSHVRLEAKRRAVESLDQIKVKAVQ